MSWPNSTERLADRFGIQDNEQDRRLSGRSLVSFHSRCILGGTVLKSCPTRQTASFVDLCNSFPFNNLKVRPTRLELVTFGSVDRCSIQLSYGHKFSAAKPAERTTTVKNITTGSRLTSPPGALHVARGDSPIFAEMKLGTVPRRDPSRQTTGAGPPIARPYAPGQARKAIEGPPSESKAQVSSLSAEQAPLRRQGDDVRLDRGLVVGLVRVGRIARDVGRISQRTAGWGSVVNDNRHRGRCTVAMLPRLP